jgi:hypothetical protein
MVTLKTAFSNLFHKRRKMSLDLNISARSTADLYKLNKQSPELKCV